MRSPVKLTNKQNRELVKEFFEEQLVKSLRSNKQVLSERVGKEVGLHLSQTPSVVHDGACIPSERVEIVVLTAFAELAHSKVG